jgi:hypothetical protein
MWAVLGSASHEMLLYMHQPNDAPPAGRHEHINVSIGDCGLCGHGCRTVQSVELS